MKMMNSAVLALMVFLSGCAAVEKQAFNRAANTSIRTITIIEPKPTEGFGVTVLNHPALSFGLIGATIYATEMTTKSNSFDAVMKPLGWSLSDELITEIAKELELAGYVVKRLKVERERPSIKDYAGIKGDKKNAEALASDAWLDVATRDPLYVANSPTADYVPSIGVTARLVSSTDQSLLYREDIFFGFSFVAPRLEAVVIPADQEFRFPTHTDLLADPAKSLKGVRMGVPQIAKRLARDLARDSGATPVATSK
jgi:hypothetical protein